MDSVYLSIIESIYLIYIFEFFETSVDFNFMASPEGWWWEHLVGEEKGLRVCPFGQVAIFFLIALLLSRHYIKIPKYAMYISFLIAFILSLMNLNAMVYLLPVWFLEAFYFF